MKTLHFFKSWSKALHIFLLMLLTAPLAVSAQETLTVYEGTQTSQLVPAYIFYFDDFTRSQFVVPATALSEMNGGEISSVTFYTTSDNVPYTAVSATDVYIKEVDYTAISAFEPKTNATMVFSGYLSVTSVNGGGELTVTFNEPYQYQGGNLLIGCENTHDIDYKKNQFLWPDSERRLRSWIQWLQFERCFSFTARLHS